MVVRIFKYLRFFNFKTIVFNFKYFPLRQAIKFPIFISRNVCLKKLQGRIIINCELRPGLVKIGFGDVGIFDNKRSKTIWEVKGNITFAGRTEIGHGCKVSVHKNGNLKFGKNFKVTAESTIIASNRITIGDDCIFSWDILIMDTDFHSIIDMNNRTINYSDEIAIGNKVWIGCRCTILKGTTIPNNSVIAANSFISAELSGENQIFGGYPAKVLKSNISWDYKSPIRH